MRKLLVFVSLVGFTISFNAQNLNPKKLNDQISELNNSKRYNEAIEKLEDIINSDDYTSYDKFHAFLQKSFTYKRLYHYYEALDNLDNALEIGRKSDKIDEVETRVALERLFIAFDRQKPEEVEKYLAEIDKSKLGLINATTRSFYVSILAILNMREGKLVEADKQLDEAIQLVQASSPKDLPNIYRKKVALYDQMGKPDLALKAYEKGMYFAEKYNTEIYKIIMLETLTKHYIENKDYKNALEAQQKVSDARAKYDHLSHAGELSLLEKNLSSHRKDVELDYEKKVKYALFSTLAIFLILLFVLFKLYKSNKEKNQLIIRENERMRGELENLTHELNEKGEDKLDISEYTLTERQIQIINLVKIGKTNKEIGSELFISENTVKYHLKIIYNILGIENRSDLKA